MITPYGNIIIIVIRGLCVSSESMTLSVGADIDTESEFINPNFAF